MKRFTLTGLMVRHPGPGPISRLTPPATGPELIRCCRQRRAVGDEARPTVGALKLADWIVADIDRLAAQSGPWNPISHGERIERILAGEIMPGEEFAEAIAEMTDGDVIPAMFAETLQSIGITIVDDDPEEAEAPAPEPTFCRGRLGDDLPSGPIFEAVTIPQTHDFVLTGAGLAMRLSLPSAEAMRAALDDGIAFARDVRLIEGART